MRRKALRDRKCGERLGPYQQCDPLSVAQDVFLFCKADRFKACIQKKKHAAEGILFSALFVYLFDLMDRLNRNTKLNSRFVLNLFYYVHLILYFK